MEGKGNLLVKEFLNVTRFLIQSGKVQQQQGFLLVPRNALTKILNKNQYETEHTKLSYWKKLHWISTDEERFTKQVSVGGKRIRFILIDIKIFQALEFLFEEKA